MEDITVEQILDWEYDHGECFIDQNEHKFNGVTISCFMMGSNPELAPLFWQLINKEQHNLSIQNTLELYEEHEGYSDDPDEDNYYRNVFYRDFLKCINTTVTSKERVIKILKDED